MHPVAALATFIATVEGNVAAASGAHLLIKHVDAEQYHGILPGTRVSNCGETCSCHATDVSCTIYQAQITLGRARSRWAPA